MREPLLASSISGCGLEQYAEEQGEQGGSVPAELSEPRNESRLYRALSGSNWKAGLSTVHELALIAGRSGARSLALLALAAVREPRLRARGELCAPRASQAREENFHAGRRRLCRRTFRMSGRG